MKRKKVIVVVIIILLIGSIGIVVFNKSYNNRMKEQENLTIEEKYNNEILNFIKSISGLKGNNFEIINNPIGFKGQIFAPEEAIQNGINYYLKKNNNDKMNDLKVKLINNSININVNYKANNYFNTPVEVSIKPEINENKDLVINISELKVLDLKISKWVVNLIMNSFVKDWFPENDNSSIQYNDGNVIIDRKSFNGYNIESLELNNQGLTVDLIVDLKKVTNNH